MFVGSESHTLVWFDPICAALAACGRLVRNGKALEVALRRHQSKKSYQTIVWRALFVRWKDLMLF